MTDSTRLDPLRGLDLPWGDGQFEQELQQVIDLSDFAWERIQRYPHWLTESWPALSKGESTESSWSLPEANQTGQEAEWMAALRQHRQRACLEILWQDVIGRWSLDQVLEALSDLADRLIGAAFERAERQLVDRHGRPCDRDGRPQSLVVIGMGKLGGRELNFSSDVDLIAAYPHGGETDGDRSLDNEQFFARQIRLAVKWLNERTADGFVYRVDLRLRPFGDAGRPALSFAAMEDYYQREGRDWERYAWIKARPVAGDLAAGEELLETLRPFVYRRYLDYSAFEALREMKAMIRAEVDRRQLEDDIKLGAGGIREIEFIAQAFQLIRGGREPQLRQRGLRATLATLGDQQLLETELVVELDRAYVLLRRLENRLQQVADRQTHQIPESADQRERIARSLGDADWSSLAQVLEAHRERVRATFSSIFEANVNAAEEADEALWERAWDRADQPDELAELLSRAGFQDPSTQANRLARFRDSAAYRSLGERARGRLGRFMPQLLQTVSSSDQPDRVMESVMQVVYSIATRSAYVSLLSERPAVLERLVELCRASSWLTDLIARHPLLLDDLIDARIAADVVERVVVAGDGQPFRQAVEDRLGTVPDGDLEAEMEALRLTQQSQSMAIAIATLDGRLQPHQVSTGLTLVAEALLEAVFRLSWRDMVRRHGEPGGDAPGMLVVGYGTLGGRELNFTSDLDLVFLHHGGEPGGSTDGERPIPNDQFFVRTARRILHLLTTLTAAGRLYEVDVRLRPNGNSGFLVSELAAFEEYQQHQAWTWELQALTRARPVAGHRQLDAAFLGVRSRVLCRSRDPEALRADLLDMRMKMRTELDRSDARQFDLKQGPGGKVDVEFLAQWLRLRFGETHPELFADTATVAVMEQSAALGLIDQSTASELAGAYRSYQRVGQKLALQQRPQLLEADDLLDHREAVMARWDDLLRPAQV